MERMIINKNQRTIPCASIDCEKLVQISVLDQENISKGNVVVVRCGCGKNFEVEAEKEVE